MHVANLMPLHDQLTDLVYEIRTHDPADQNGDILEAFERLLVDFRILWEDSGKELGLVVNCIKVLFGKAQAFIEKGPTAEFRWEFEFGSTMGSLDGLLLTLDLKMQAL
jgi:hypothetical protein